MRFRVALVLGVLAGAALGAGPANAGERSWCRHQGDPDNPMMTSESYGLAQCNPRRAPRYHANDYGDVAPPDWRHVSDDPMVWNRNQWRSDLFSRPSRSYDDRFDRRFRARDESPMVHIDIQRTIVQRWSEAVEMGIERARPQVRVFGAKDNRLGVSIRSARPSRVKCAGAGMLVLVWSGARAEAICPATGIWRGRIELPPADLGHDQG